MNAHQVSLEDHDRPGTQAAVLQPRTHAAVLPSCTSGPAVLRQAGSGSRLVALVQFVENSSLLITQNLTDRPKSSLAAKPGAL